MVTTDSTSNLWGHVLYASSISVYSLPMHESTLLMTLSSPVSKVFFEKHHRYRQCRLVISTPTSSNSPRPPQLISLPTLYPVFFNNPRDQFSAVHMPVSVKSWHRQPTNGYPHPCPNKEKQFSLSNHQLPLASQPRLIRSPSSDEILNCLILCR